jgi:hypothetical protein
MKDVYAIFEPKNDGRDRARWVRVGVAFPNRDGSLNVLMEHSRSAEDYRSANASRLKLRRRKRYDTHPTRHVARRVQQVSRGVRRQSNRDHEARFVRDTFQPVDSPMRLVDSSVCVV